MYTTAFVITIMVIKLNNIIIQHKKDYRDLFAAGHHTV